MCQRYLKAGRFAEAFKLLNSALELNPELQSGKWGPIAVDLLFKRLQCAKKLENYEVSLTIEYQKYIDLIF